VFAHGAVRGGLDDDFRPRFDQLLHSDDKRHGEFAGEGLAA